MDLAGLICGISCSFSDAFGSVWLPGAGMTDIQGVIPRPEAGTAAAALATAIGTDENQALKKSMLET